MRCPRRRACPRSRLTAMGSDAVFAGWLLERSAPRGAPRRRPSRRAWRAAHPRRRSASTRRCCARWRSWCRWRRCTSRTTWRRSGPSRTPRRTCRRSPASTPPSTAPSRRLAQPVALPRALHRRGRPPLRLPRPVLRVHRLAPGRARRRRWPRGGWSWRISATAPASAPCGAAGASPPPWASPPLDGLMMGTRCGALDPGVLLHLIREPGWSPELERLLYPSAACWASRASPGTCGPCCHRRAGSGRSHRAVRLPDRARGGSLAAALGGLDALVFTAGIGLHQPAVRAAVCDGLGFLGAAVDDAANARPMRATAPASARPALACKSSWWRMTRTSRSPGICGRRLVGSAGGVA